MTDLITAAIHQAQGKGTLGRADVLLRYFKIKYRLIVSNKALEGRIKRIKSENIK